MDKSKGAGEPVNQDAFIFWKMLKKTYDDPEKLLDHFNSFMVDQQKNLQKMDDDEDNVDSRSGGSVTESPNLHIPTNPQNSSNGKNSNGTSGGENSDSNYVVIGQIASKGDNKLIASPTHSSKISFAYTENPQTEQLNQTMLQTINCKLQLIPPELNHFTLNLDNHVFSERLFLSICATIINNNKNYQNRHLATTLKESPITTVKKKKIQQEIDQFIQQYYFTLTKLSLKKTMLSHRSVEALSQALAMNRSIVELDLGGNELECRGVALLLSGIRENKTITRLNLSDVRAYDEGAFMISAYLMATKSIRIIDLSSNHISEKGFEALKQAASRNIHIQSIYLYENNIDQPKLHSLQSILTRNTCVQGVIDHLLDQIPWNRKIKNRLQSFKKSVMQTRTNSTLNISQEDERTPLFRLLSKQSQLQLNAGANGTPSHTIPESESTRFKVGKSETIGKRPTMEDRMVTYGSYRGDTESELFAIFDGHGGRAASDYAADNINRILSEHLQQQKTPEEAFKLTFTQINTQLTPWPFIGTTAACAYIHKSHVYIANVGDSRVVLGRMVKQTPIVHENNDNDQDNTQTTTTTTTTTSNETKVTIQTKRLTFDHRPVEDSERSRITNAGGTVLNGRVNGMLAVSRALGDSFLTPYVIPEPYQSSFEITSEDKFLILACDGVWDLISDEEAVLIVSKISDPEKSSETLRDLAFNMGSTDNISVMVVKLNDY